MVREILTRLKVWAKNLKRDVFALWIASRSPKTPITAKLLAGAVAAYALSPIDLIPDFIPILGYLDDIVLVPLGIALVIRLIPPVLMAEFRQQAVGMDKPTGRVIAIFVVGGWTIGFVICAVWLRGKLG